MDTSGRGKTVRIQVLGQARYDAVTERTTAFGRPFQELVNRYCWGETWDRLGLSLKMRSIVTMAMLLGLGRRNELRGHIKGAITNGFTQDEMQELFLQACIYCGIPADGEAFRIAKEVFAEADGMSA